MKHIAIIGAGPTGLMAAEAAIETGAQVSIYDAMPSVARKFLMAGKSGLNISAAAGMVGAAADRRRPPPCAPLLAGMG